MIDKNNMNGKVIWITGSGRGIGQATAKLLAQYGAKVVISARTIKEIEDVSLQIRTRGDCALAIKCDVRKEGEITSLVKQVKKEWGSIDILINNAGVSLFKKIIETDLNEWNSLLDSNLTSAFLCTKAVLADMIKNKSGKIINIVSVAGIQAYPNCSGYCASKYGLRGFTDVLRLETRQYGIKVTALLPGATNTNIWGHADFDFSRMMTPDDVALTILHICQSSDNSHIEEVIVRPQGGDL